jgi:CelD/BcsL family acetyltransferase involved in cellulose biosynthesis
VPPDLELEPLGDLEALGDEWRPLAERTRNVFSTWEWARTWWRHFGDGREQSVVGWREPDGALAGILPVYLHSRGPLRVARFIGQGPADQLGAVCAPDTQPAAARALAGALRRGPLRAGVFVGDNLLVPERWPDLLGGTVLRREPTPLLHVRGRGWDEFLASKSSNFRSQVRRNERKLVRDHGLAFRLAAGDTLDSDFPELVRLHREQWGARSDAFAGPLEAFHRDFAQVALERGWLRLWLAEIEGRVVAAWYGFRYAGVESYYQSGRSGDWDRLSVGRVLLVHSMRCAFEDGLDEYRLLRGGEAYKDRFADEDPGLETVAVGRGAGRALVGAADLLRRVPAGRRLLGRAGR